MSAERGASITTHHTPHILDSDPDRHPHLLGSFENSPRRLVLVDTTFRKAYDKQLHALYKRYGAEYVICDIGAGEESKTPEAHAGILDCIHDFKFVQKLDRAQVWGGGAAHDAGGYGFMVADRGIPWDFYGTTGTAGGDAGPAFKVGSHWRGHRAGVGGFWPANNFRFDPTLLATVPTRDLVASLAEFIKIGLIRDKPLLDHIAKFGKMLVDTKFQGSTPEHHLAIRRLLLDTFKGILAEIDKQPYEDISNRRPSWIGHNLVLLEQAAGLRHGEVVTLDTLATLHVARRRGIMSKSALEYLTRVYHSVGLPLWHPIMAEHGLLDESLKITAAHRWGEQAVPVVSTLGDNDGIQYLTITPDALHHALDDMYNWSVRIPQTMSSDT